jgi:tetratricopeptide (TPR) repeat protein
MDSALKARGNACYQKKEFREAISLYSEAIDESNSTATNGSDQNSKMMGVLYGNRCACYLALSDFQSARADAEAAILIDAECEKYYYRYASALKGLGQTEQSLAVLETGLSKCSKAESLTKLKETLILLAETTTPQPKMKAVAVDRGYVPKGFLNNSSNESNPQVHSGDCCRLGTAPEDSLCLSCVEKPPVRRKKKKPVLSSVASSIAQGGAIAIETVPSASYSDLEYQMLTDLRAIVRGLQAKEDRAMSEHHLQGSMFQRLSDGKQFADILFPGVPVSSLKDLPKSLGELLMWKELTLDLTKIAR